MNNKILVLIDGSYFMYYVIFGAVNTFIKQHKFEANLLIKPPELVDQNNLPDILTSDNYKKCLKSHLIKACEKIDWILKSNFQNEIDSADGIDIIFARDSNVRTNYKAKLFPGYKVQRTMIKRSYDISKIKHYITSVLFNELNIENTYQYIPIYVDEAEGDDIIACTIINNKQYSKQILIASDKDFQQLKDVAQFDLNTKPVKTVIKQKKAGSDATESVLTPEDALMVKIISGDSADNIPPIFDKCGKITAYKLISGDKKKLKKLLAENNLAAKQFLLNRQLIDFKYMPKELSDRICETVNKALQKNDFNNIELMQIF